MTYDTCNTIWIRVKTASPGCLTKKMSGNPLLTFKRILCCMLNSPYNSSLFYKVWWLAATLINSTCWLAKYFGKKGYTLYWHVSYDLLILVTFRIVTFYLLCNDLSRVNFICTNWKHPQRKVFPWEFTGTDWSMDKSSTNTPIFA